MRFILLALLLTIPLVTAAPDISAVSQITGDGQIASISGSNFGLNPNANEAAFLGGINGWTANQPAGTYLKTQTPFSTAPNSEWNYVYSGNGVDDIISDQDQRVPGKNTIRLRSGVLSPQGAFDSTFGLDTEQPNQDFFISFWVKPHIEQLIYDYFECNEPLYPRHGEICIPQIKFFSFAPHADAGQAGVIDANFYGSNRNQAVFGTRVYPDGSGHKMNGFGHEFYSLHGSPLAGLQYDICGTNQWVFPTTLPYLYAVGGPEYIGGYNGQSCFPYDWVSHAKGGTTAQREAYGLPFDEWSKVQIWVKGGEFDTWDGKLVWQVILPDGTHEKSVDVTNINMFTQLYGDNGEFTYPRRFFFYGYFGQNCIENREPSTEWPNGISCAADTNGDLMQYVDDFFIQPGTIAHIELGDAPIYEDTTHLEIQKPLSWSQDAISFEVNYGTFQQGQQVWLFVVDEFGVASTGFPIILESNQQDSLLMHSSMGSNAEMWQPEVNQNTYSSESQAIRGSVSFEASPNGNAAVFGPVPRWNGDVWMPVENFDFFDPDMNGGRLDILLKWNQDPQGPSSNTWIGFDPYTINGGRNINLEMTDNTPRFPMFMIEGDVQHDRTNQRPTPQFRANTGSSNSLWNSINQGEWHTYTYVWRNNGDQHKDQAHIFIDGELVASDFNGNLPTAANMNAFAFGATEGGNIAFSIDEVYSFNSWNSGSSPVPSLNWPQGVTLMYPMNYEGPQYGYDVFDTNTPTYQWFVQNDQESVSSCDLYVDGNYIQTINNIQNLEHVEVTPNVQLSVGSHTWNVNCGSLISPTYTFQVTYVPPNPWPLQISGRNLVDQQGNPFIIVGDTPWSLMVTPDYDQAIQYLDNRKNKGFNTLLINIIEQYYNPPNNNPINAYGDHPFVGGDYDWSQPNEAYWSHVDRIIQAAKDRGFLLLLTPAYAGYDCNISGWCDEMDSQSDAVMTTYGQFLANRYKDYDNIIWVTGGDVDLPIYRNSAYLKQNKILDGIRSIDPDALFTAHSKRWSEAGSVYSASNLDIYTTYASCDPSNTLTSPQMLKRDYDRTPTAPFFDIEGWYEGEHSTGRECLVSQAMYAYLSGSLGHMFGNYPIWTFASGWNDDADSLNDGTNSPGSVMMENIAGLTAIRDFGSLVPDYNNQIVISGNTPITSKTYSSAASINNGETLLVYFEADRDQTIDMSKVSGPVQAYWFNPWTNEAIDAGTYSNSGTQVFNPPTNALLLILDDQNAGLTTPGIINAPVDFCGDNMCTGTESCNSCSQDCGTCPPVGDSVVLQNGLTVVGTTYDGQRDNCISKLDPDNNHHSSGSSWDECQIVNGQWSTSPDRYLLLDFDTSKLSSRPVVSATIELYNIYQYMLGDTTVEVYSLNNNFDWADVTWNCNDDNGLDGVCDDISWTGGNLGSKLDDVLIIQGENNRWYSWDVTNEVQSWLDNPSSNNGFLIKPLEYSFQQKFADYNYPTQNLQPKLTIRFGTEATIVLDYDLDENGLIEFFDLALVASSYYGSELNDGIYDPRYDYDGDGKIDIIDLITHINNWDAPSI